MMTDADLDQLTRDAAALPPGPYEIIQWQSSGHCAVRAAGSKQGPGVQLAFIEADRSGTTEEHARTRSLAETIARIFVAVTTGLITCLVETIRQERAARRAAEVEVAKLRAELEVRRASDKRPRLYQATGAFRCTDGGKPALHVPNKVENGLGSFGYQYRDIDAILRAWAVVPGERRRHPRDGEYIELIPLDEAIAAAVKAAEARAIQG